MLLHGTLPWVANHLHQMMHGLTCHVSTCHPHWMMHGLTCPVSTCHCHRVTHNLTRYVRTCHGLTCQVRTCHPCWVMRGLTCHVRTCHPHKNKARPNVPCHYATPFTLAQNCTFTTYSSSPLHSIHQAQLCIQTGTATTGFHNKFSRWCNSVAGFSPCFVQLQIKSKTDAS